MYKLNSEGEPHEIQSYEDDNYFRLNIWGMGKARNLTLWGHGIMSATELLEQEMKFHQMMNSKRKFEPAEMIKLMVEAQADLVKTTESMIGHWDTEVTNESYESDYASFLDPFGTNGNEATSEQCSVFAEGILNALAMIEAASVVPEALSDLEIFREFAEWLNASPHGVYVG